MDLSSIAFLKEISLEAATLFIAFGVVFTFIIGLWLLMQPTSALRFIQSMNMWYSPRRSMKPLEVPRFQERAFYRHHKIWGVLLLAGAGYSLYYFLFDYDQARLVHDFSRYFNKHIADWLLEAISLFLLLGNVFVMLIGIIILLRPGLLKSFEAQCNRWISTRKVYKFLDIEHNGADSMLTRNPKVLGVLIILASLYVLVNFTLLVVTKNMVIAI